MPLCLRGQRRVSMDISTYQPLRSENIVFRDIEGEGILYQVEQAKVHVLNGTAYAIWKQCDGKHTIEQIAKELTKTFQVDEQTALEDVKKSVQEFRNLKLLQDREDSAGQ
ncbi:MAG: hypothetical protein DRQ02_07715 [Candidatus Latescibacterota bacterium]|nr:MAG: hypothetical protein DRQ02_07715 [Candidatus Latescibacterota bacterium]RKY71258.1 MAG: hypothetical protein DRQ24_07745 [Candidatus Latescibacterota bacterium]